MNYSSTQLYIHEKGNTFMIVHLSLEIKVNNYNNYKNQHLSLKIKIHPKSFKKTIQYNAIQEDTISF